jgi:hypothetical protein
VCAIVASWALLAVVTAAEKDNGTVEGPVIGIDLGTTYRYVFRFLGVFAATRRSAR